MFQISTLFIPYPCKTCAHVTTLRNCSTWVARGAAPERMSRTFPPSPCFTCEYVVKFFSKHISIRTTTTTTKSFIPLSGNSYINLPMLLGNIRTTNSKNSEKYTSCQQTFLIIQITLLNTNLSQIVAASLCLLPRIMLYSLLQHSRCKCITKKAKQYHKKLDN